MTNILELYLYTLKTANWQQCDQIKIQEKHHSQWLLKTNSLTEQLRSYCTELKVVLIDFRDASLSELSDYERSMINNTESAIREVILLGDDVPWLCARTLIPKTLLNDSKQAQTLSSTTPIGESIFTHPNVRRDNLEIAEFMIECQHLFARRSRLWLGTTPLLVSELFLPQSPIYWNSE